MANPLQGINMRGGGTYTAEEDIYEQLADGRVVQVALKGSSMPMDIAILRGFVKLPDPPKPTELKAEPAAEPKDVTSKVQSALKSAAKEVEKTQLGNEPSRGGPSGSQGDTGKANS